MSTDVRLDENGNPDLSNGKDFISGTDELKQSLEMRLLSQVGWAVNDVNFGVEWLDFFGELKDTQLAADKISESLEKDDRVSSVTSVDVIPNYQERIASIKITMILADDNLISENGNPNLTFNTSLAI